MLRICTSISRTASLSLRTGGVRYVTKYTKDHEYVVVTGATGVVGISNHAQAQLGDIVYVDLPEVGRKVKKG